MLSLFISLFFLIRDGVLKKNTVMWMELGYVNTMKKLLLILAFIVTGTSMGEQNRAELQPTVCEPTGFQFCDDNSTHPYCVRFYGNYYEYYGGVVQTPYNSNEKTTTLLHLKSTN